MDFKKWIYKEAINLDLLDTQQAMKQLIAQAFHWMDWSGGDGEGYRYAAKEQLEREQESKHFFASSPTARYWSNSTPEEENEVSQEEIEERARELATEELSESLFSKIYEYRQFEDPVRLYREITVMGRNKKEIIRNIHLIRLGAYWSHDEKSAYAHWGNWRQSYTPVTLYTEISSHYIDWEETLIKNIIPSYAEEKEIKVIEGTQIVVSAIKIKDSNWQKIHLTGFA